MKDLELEELEEYAAFLKASEPDLDSFSYRQLREQALAWNAANPAKRIGRLRKIKKSELLKKLKEVQE